MKQTLQKTQQQSSHWEDKSGESKAAPRTFTWPCRSAHRKDFALETRVNQERNEAGKELGRWQKEETGIDPAHFHIYFLT